MQLIVDKLNHQLTGEIIMKQISEEKLKELENYLVELPAKFAIPLMNFLKENLVDVATKEVE